MWPLTTDVRQPAELLWLPCVALWVTSLAYLPYLLRVPVIKGRGWIEGFTSAKTFLPCVLCALCIATSVKNLSFPDQSPIATSLYIAECVRAVTYLYSGMVCIVEKRRGLVTSRVHLLFWVLVVLCDATSLCSIPEQKDVLSSSMFVLRYAIVLGVLLLHVFSKAGGIHGCHSIRKDVSPELTASLISRLTFSWIQPMMSVGYNKSLEAKDVFVMDQANQSRNIVPAFEKNWAAEEDRINRFKAKRTPDLERRSLPTSSGEPCSPSSCSDTLSHYGTRTDSPSLQMSAQQRRSAKQNDMSTRRSRESGQGRNEGRTRGGSEGQAKTSVQGQGQEGSCSSSAGGVCLAGSEVEIGASAPSREGSEVQPSLFRVLVATYWVPFFIGQSLMLMYTLLQFINPVILNVLLDYVKNGRDDHGWQGYLLAWSFFVASFVATLLYHQAMHNMRSLGMRIKSALISAVYGKALTMSNVSRRQSTVGQIVNLMSLDCQKLQDITMSIFLLWSTPLTIVIAIVLLWGTLGPASLAGLLVMVLVIPANTAVVKKQRSLQKATMRIKDQRLKLMAEILNGIKVIKLYGWESSFRDRVLHQRNKELDKLQKIAYLLACTVFIWTIVPYLVTLTSFAAYVLTSEPGYLDPTTAFVSLSLFNMMRTPINMLPTMIPSVIEAGVSLRRINRFLNRADLDPYNVIKDRKTDGAFVIENGTFTWEGTSLKPTLRNISLNIQQGQLVAVVGPVGCGKSSLLSAMLGEMERLSGTVATSHTIAYVPQEAWIQNATVRDNILFGKSLSRRRYDQVVHACALNADFESMTAGDMTEIGEKGINLSGGQKQRVSLARAVYSDEDTYLLDDPLSAVDSHVGAHIFHHVIGRQGLLADKTRVLVTHGVHWLPMVDQIVVINDGAVSEVGSYEQLLRQDGAFATFLRTYASSSTNKIAVADEANGSSDSLRIGEFAPEFRASRAEGSDGKSGDFDDSARGRKGPQEDPPSCPGSGAEKPLAQGAASSKPKGEPKLVEEEQSMTGSVKLSVYASYMQALGTTSCLVILTLFLLYQASCLAASVWLSMWTDDPHLANTSQAHTDTYLNTNRTYLAVYGYLGASQVVFILSFAVLYYIRMVRATGRLHAAMLSNVLRSPMAFFDTTPIGRIINRFSRDVDVMDVGLPLLVRTTLQGVWGLIGTLFLIAYGSPAFICVVVPLGVVYRLIQMFYIRTSRQLKRLESTTRSPVYTHFTETVQGAPSIRAYDVTARFIAESQNRVDKNLVCYYAYISAQRWLGVRLDLLGSFTTLAAAIFAVINTDLSSGLVGLSVTFAMTVSGSLNFLVRVTSELESNIVATERIREYTEKATEAPWTHPERPVRDDWPEKGNIEFKDFRMRYRPGLDLALRGISCRIQPGEKIGIVGRTGAGKSSLSMALFRLTEAAGGCIVIDGHAIGQLGLHDLRRRLTILPQDPVIFSGTLRTNLDPTRSHCDDELWNAVDLAHLRTFVSQLPGMLDYECGEGGNNLSVGQRQLVCLARAVLRKSKILVLDEATAAVDMETDDIIQQTIRSEFKGSTVLTIAHRLNTIMDYDRIVVMEDGRIKELASPEQLLSNPNSDFFGMAKAAGLV